MKIIKNNDLLKKICFILISISLMSVNLVYGKTNVIISVIEGIYNEEERAIYIITKDKDTLEIIDSEIYEGSGRLFGRVDKEQGIMLVYEGRNNMWEVGKTYTFIVTSTGYNRQEFSVLMEAGTDSQYVEVLMEKSKLEEPTKPTKPNEPTPEEPTKPTLSPEEPTIKPSMVGTAGQGQSTQTGGTTAKSEESIQPAANISTKNTIDTDNLKSSSLIDDTNDNIDENNIDKVDAISELNKISNVNNINNINNDEELIDIDDNLKNDNDIIEIVNLQTESIDEDMDIEIDEQNLNQSQEDLDKIKEQIANTSKSGFDFEEKKLFSALILIILLATIGIFYLSKKKKTLLVVEEDIFTAEYIAENFLENSSKINVEKNIFIFTGTSNGKKIYVMNSSDMKAIEKMNYAKLHKSYNVENITRLENGEIDLDKFRLFGLTLINKK